MTIQRDITDDTVARWYIVHTYSGQEDRVQKNLQQNFLEIREGVLVRSLADFEEGVLCYKDNTRDFKRDAGFLVRLWESQGRKCAISGKEILPRQLFDGKLVQVDHVKPHSKGGQTVEANAQLTFALENQKKRCKV